MKRFRLTAGTIVVLAIVAVSWSTLAIPHQAGATIRSLPTAKS